MAVNYNVNQLIKAVLAEMPVRHKKVIEGRYSLAGGDPLTLAELGGAYSLTRERIRQIEAIALKSIQEKIGNVNLGGFVKAAVNYLKSVGNLKREDLLIRDLSLLAEDKDETAGASRVKFLLEVCGKFNYAKETDNYHAYWYLTPADQKKAVGFVVKVLNAWNSRKNNAELADFYKTFTALTKSAGITEAVALNYSSLSKEIAMNCYGDLGPSSSSEINPKTSRDWAYLVLKKESRPIHFTELAQLIAKLKCGSIHAPTVHNELIKDARFVLVGKGTYSLKEFGIVPGTAREIINHYIKKHGPMKAKEVVQLVLKDRLFKENTIFINLQNKRHFKRLDDGRYTTLV